MENITLNANTDISHKLDATREIPLTIKLHVRFHKSNLGMKEVKNSLEIMDF